MMTQRPTEQSLTPLAEAAPAAQPPCPSTTEMCEITRPWTDETSEVRTISSTADTERNETEGSCGFRIALYRGDIFVKEYQGKSQGQIAKDILESFGAHVDGGALWRTMKRWTGSKSASGFSLRAIDGKLRQPDTTRSLLKALSNAKPAILRHDDGRSFIVWSYQHRDATALGYNAGNMGMHLRRKGYSGGSGGWRGRFLTETECARLIAHSPYYYEVEIDSAVERGWNLSRLAKEKGFAEARGTPPPNASRIIRTGAGVCTAYGRRISGRIVYTGAPIALLVTDELAEKLEGLAIT